MPPPQYQRAPKRSILIGLKMSFPNLIITLLRTTRFSLVFLNCRELFTASKFFNSDLYTKLTLDVLVVLTNE